MTRGRPMRAERLRFIAGLSEADRSEDPGRVLTIAYAERVRWQREDRFLWGCPAAVRRDSLRWRRAERKRIYGMLASRAFFDAAAALRRASPDAVAAAWRVLRLLERLDALALLERYDANLRALDAGRRRARWRRDLLWDLLGRVSSRGGASKRGVRVGHAVRATYGLLPRDTPAPNALVRDLLHLVGIETDRHTVGWIRRQDSGPRENTN